ncbi:hypothetical protein B566_EDAN002492 [Ephemera danica]|nr:hypothetical protein B566_EDAN002492 [Ephemera danica]
MRLLLALCLVATTSAQWDPHNVPGHSTIVHLFEWPWASIAAECENWLGPKGFGGIQISVPTENAIVSGRPWYERYQPISYFFNTRSGNEAELADMLRRCNAAGVRVYPDIVFNHMTGAADTLTGTGGSTAEPNNKLYPAVPYGPNDFNPSCDITNWNDPANVNFKPMVRDCELLGLKDLAQSQDYVRQKISDMLNRLIDMGVAGFRVDAAKHMWPGDMENIMGRLTNLNTDHGFAAGSRAMLFQEVIDLGGSIPSPSEYFYLGRVTEFKQGMELGRAFQGLNQLKWLSNFGEPWGLMPDGNALCFIDNHDNQRHGGSDILTYKNPKPYKMATAFELAWTYGYPRMMSSFDFGNNPDLGPPHDSSDNIIGPGFNADDTCTNGWELRWALGGTMETTKLHFVAEIKDLSLLITRETCLAAGTYCDVISGSKSGTTCTGKTVTVAADGTANIVLGAAELDGTFKRKMMRFLLALCLVATVQSQWDPHNVPGHSTIVHLFEWPWASIADECENWLGPKGFGGIQISVPTENAVIEPRPWWERYQPISYFFNTRSGTETELADMIRRCNAAGVRDCELLGLKDLDQSQEYVQQKISEMLNRLIDMGVAGFRVDAAKHMWPGDMENIMGRLTDLNTDHGFAAGSRAMLFQEVIAGGGGPTPAEYFNLGRVTEFNQGRELGRAFQGGNQLMWLQSFGEEWGLIPDQYALCFMDNHDNQRHGGSDILTYKNPRPYKMATAFELAWTYGYPRMMSSFGFDDPDAGPPHDLNDNILGPGFYPDDTCSNGWICEHRWRQMYNMVAFRNAVEGTVVQSWWDNGNNQIAFCRGNRGFIAFNNEGYDMNVNLQTCLPAGTYCDVISGSKIDVTCTGKTVTVAADGTADISLNVTDEDGVLAIHVNAKL